MNPWRHRLAQNFWSLQPTRFASALIVRLLVLGLFLTCLQSTDAYEIKYANTGFQVTSGMDYAINYELKKLIARHEAAFKRQAPADFKITYYVFATYEQYRDYAAKNQRKVTPKLLGYTTSKAAYDPKNGTIVSAEMQVVSWKQAQPAIQLSTLLHESAHAVTHAFLLQVPLWMNEGSADWFGQPAWAANGNAQKLDRFRRWQTLQIMLEEKKLPPIRPYLESEEYDDWAQMFQGNVGMGYVVGYSIFDFFMSHANAQVFLNQLLKSDAVEKGDDPGKAFTKAIDKQWPGGLAAFEKSWHQWILRKAEAERQLAAKDMKAK